MLSTHPTNLNSYYKYHNSNNTREITQVYNDISDKYSDYSDEELANLYITKGDENSFNEITYRYMDKIYRLSLTITKNTYDAEEVLQNVFLILVEKFQYFRQESKFSTWLYRITVNTAYSFIRIQKRDKEFIIEYPGIDENYVNRGLDNYIPDEVEIKKETLDILFDLIQELPEKYRIAVQLRDIEDVSNQEAALILNISTTAFKSRLQRGRKILFKKFTNLTNIIWIDFIIYLSK